ncbi:MULTISPECIES: DUF3488 and transglutaminase-like domain-containing protein [Ramlibacter]|uniref:DUF3488 domain-containing transglutaminase family protein n=1 Tax=Ramlibacter aquaticus TaxID=2780094 RepID=A0ABR9SEE4_9BURK|nr:MULTISPECIES: DUF3488 and transglutaminase-like domain-containing protein [Ramlibacter]MBE7940589.1 DUF3488 domain-containing transglutaminase family protein [Ramlibacter aquaticus]
MLNRWHSLPRDARDTLFLLVVIGWVILPHLANLPVWCSALAVVVLLWRGVLALGSRPLPAPRWVLGTLLVAVGATLFTHRTLLGRDAGVTLIVVLLALKTLELRARRDTFVVFFLGFFTMLTNFFFSQSLPIAAGMLVGLLGLLTAVVLAHMPVGKPPLLEAARTAGWMTLLGAPVMAALFVLFPRLGPLWGAPSDAMSGRSGLSSSMQVGNLARLALDETVAMRVKFDGPPPPQSEMYFRGPVLSVFDGREWRPLQARSTTSYLPAALAQLRVGGTPRHYQVTLEPSNRPWLLTLDGTAQPPRAPGLQSFMTGELDWVSVRPLTDLLRYEADSYPLFQHGPTSEAGVLPEYTQLPEGYNPRTLELAGRMTRDPALVRGGNEALVRAALERLRTGGYTYTLDPGTYGPNSADEFWFDRKEGFCEHIASAFVVLMRALTIPARVVTGYQGGERNPVDGYWTVRQSDAHAWAEVWLEGRGWVRVDPTAMVAPGRVGSFQRLQPQRGVLGSALVTLSPGMVASLRNAWEAVNNSWNQWVLNYTQSKQLDLLRQLGFESPSWEDLSYVLIALLVSGALLGAGWAYWERRQHDPWLRLLQRVRQRLAQAGLALPTEAPPRLMAQRVRERFGEAGAPLAEWLLQLEAQRYARTPPQTLRQLERSYHRLAWPGAR